jgi:hypothetical protein
VIPGTALGVVFVVAAFGPGYVYLRVAEQRSDRHERSDLVEAVELAVTGAFASTVALLAVAALADWLGLFDVHVFSLSPHSYFAYHPLRILWLLALVLTVAYGIAFVAAHILHRQHPANIRPGTAWTQAFRAARSLDSGLLVRATVELRDGRKVEGTLGAHSTEIAENRELLLKAPMRVLAGHSAVPESLSDDTMVLREIDILAVSGRLVQTDVMPPRNTQPWRRRISGLRRLRRHASEAERHGG